jgi:ABC-type transport system involved in multi-copper enzyme maturation permease subunit
MPIARREMLVLARSPLTFRARITAGLVTLVAGIAFGIFYSRMGIGTVFPFMGIIGYMLSLMCMFSGAQVSSDAVSKEKREGTLGLLFLTGLSAWQITCGKLIATGLSAFFGVMVTFPLLSLLLICGGVQPMEIFQICITLLNTLFVSAAMGLLISTVSLEQKRANGRASMIVVFFWWGLPMLSTIAARLGAPIWLSKGLLLFSLSSGFVPTMPGVGFGGAANPWLNLFCLHLLGWILLAWASFLIPRQWQDRPEQAKFSLRKWWKRISFGSEKVRLRLRRRLLEPNPFIWLAARDRLRFLGVWIVTIIMLGVGVLVYVSSGGQPGPMLAFSIVVTVLHRFLAAGAGATQLMVEQEQGTLEMLLSTPLSARDLLSGQFRATMHQLRGPILLGTLLQLFTAFLIWTSTSEPWVPKALIVLSLIFYFFDLYTAVWLSMWGAVIARNQKQASGLAIIRLIGVPLFTIAIGIMTISISNTFFGTRINLSPPAIIALTCLLIAANNIGWIRKIRKELPARLRSYAFRRYETEEERGLLGNLGRALGRAYGGMRRSKSAEATAQ